MCGSVAGYKLQHKLSVSALSIFYNADFSSFHTFEQVTIKLLLTPETQRTRVRFYTKGQNADCFCDVAVTPRAAHLKNGPCYHCIYMCVLCNESSDSVARNKDRFLKS